MRIGHTMMSVALMAVLLPHPAGAQADAAGTVVPLTQERVVSASASGVAPARAENADLGAFDETVSLSGRSLFCIAGICVPLPVSASASQQSLLTVTQDTLELRARLSAGGSAGPGGFWQAGSRVTSTYAVEGAVQYLLQSDGSGAFVVLEDAAGTRVEEQIDETSAVSRGRLGPGIYTLTARTAGGTLDVRFSAGPTDQARPRCIIELTEPSYRTGDVVTASRLEVSNVHVTRPVELKVWLRRPDGLEVPAHNAGADGSVAIPEGTTQNFGPLDIMGVDDATGRGLYEFGCRLLNPITGEQLDEDSDLFEVE